jgi:putative N6-adenine-specific DNA methylase
MTSFNDIQANSLILVTCPKGLASFLAEEVATLKLKVLSNFQSGVSLRGSFQDCMLLNLGLSTAHHVLFLLKEFSCANPETLYKEIASVDWENIVPPSGYVSVTSVVHTPSIIDTRFANLKCKDAIMDRLADKTGKRCDSGNLRDRTVVHLYWNDERCIVYLDTSGEPLSKRGYRLVPGSAPMQETLAAAVVQTTGWTGDSPLVNPMCGSGTITIEAALRALRRAPGILRTNFGFMHCAAYRREEYLSLVKLFSSRENAGFKGKILAADIDPSVVLDARRNAAQARVEDFIDFTVGDFRETDVPPGPGVVIFNPEYGIRLGEAEDLKRMYKDIGNFFKQRCGGYTGFVFTGNFDLAKHVGLKARKKYPFVSGKIDCRLYEYELYRGSR